MGVFSRRRAQAVAAAQAHGAQRAEAEAVRHHLEAFTRSHVGVEAYVEPPTTVIPPTVVLVANTGEWTRRRVSDPHLLRGIAEQLKIPVYDVQRTGYPQRMRDWTEWAKKQGLR